MTDIMENRHKIWVFKYQESQLVTIIENGSKRRNYVF